MCSTGRLNKTKIGKYFTKILPINGNSYLAPRHQKTQIVLSVMTSRTHSLFEKQWNRNRERDWFKNSTAFDQKELAEKKPQKLVLVTILCKLHFTLETLKGPSKNQGSESLVCIF